MWHASLVLLITVLNLCYCLNVMGKLFGEAWVCHYGDAHIATTNIAPACAGSELFEHIRHMVFGGIIECTGILERIAQSLLKYVKSRGLLVTLTIFSSFFVNLVTGNQYLALILPGRMYKEAFEDSRLKAKNLSRCLEDSGTVTSNLVPWSPCGAYMHSVFGIGQWGAVGYGPYAILCWLCPLVSIFYGFTGITMEKMTEEEYQEILIKREEELAKNQEILTA